MARRAGLDDSGIVRAAGEISDAEGFDQLSLARLAEKLQVRSPSLYKHVDGLEDVRQGVALLGARTLAARLARAAIGKSGAEGVRAVGLAYFAFAQEHPGLYTAMQRAASGDAELAAAATELIDILRAMLAPWRLSEPNLIHAIRTLRSVAHGFVSLQAEGGFAMPFALADSYDFALTLIIDGLDRIAATDEPPTVPDAEPAE